jgi:hypothetical protein
MQVAAQQQQPKVWTPQDLFQRNVGSNEQQSLQFPPHKIIGNIYYVGTESSPRISSPHRRDTCRRYHL